MMLIYILLKVLLRLSTLKKKNLLEEYSHIDGVKDLTESDSNCFRYLSHPATSISQTYVRDDNTFHWQVTIHPLEIILLQIDFNRGESDEL